MRLAQAARAEQQHVLMLGNEGTLREVAHPRLGQRGHGGEVDVLQALLVGETGLGEAALQLALRALDHLMIKERLQGR